MPSSAPAAACLLPLLQPVRHCLHPFVSSRDAARLMQTSRSITACLLSGYAFLDHVFFDCFPATADVKRSLTFYAHYDMRITRMCLPEEWNEPLVDSESGRSVLPASLIALSLGGDDQTRLAYAAFDGSYQRWNDEEVEHSDGKGHYDRLTRRWEDEDGCDTWSLSSSADCDGLFNQLLPPGALPHGLRLLQFNDDFDQPLQAGSIPDTVEMLQFGNDFKQPLQPGHLPASLTQLFFGRGYRKLLLPGVLPAGVQRLLVVGQYDQPLQPSLLPPQLRALSFDYSLSSPLPPGVIPASVTHLKLGDMHNQPLQPGSIPHGVVHLNLGHTFDQPLPAGVLPASLRELVVGRSFKQVLQPGSLPDGLEMLSFNEEATFRQELQPGVIPASVRVLSLSRGSGEELVAGDIPAIPASVEWLRLPFGLQGKALEDVVSPSTRVVWWKW